MDIQSIALEINQRSNSHPIGRLQELRRKLRGQATHTSWIFSGSTIFDEYAYHDGGRHELQFNIGYEYEQEQDADLLRYGVAFSLETSRSHPDLSELFPKIERFNDYIRTKPADLLGMKMWYSAHSVKYQCDSPRQIDRTMGQTGTFIFLGRTVALEEIDYEEILSTFDELLPLYEYIEGNEVASAYLEGQGKFKPGLTIRKHFTEASIAGGVVDVALRHNELQCSLYELLAKEYGEDHVRTEYPLECGGRVDVAVQSGDDLILYEIKVAPSARSAIREAIGQLIEYTYWPTGARSKHLVVVAEPEATPATCSYLANVRNQIRKEIYYRRLTLGPSQLYAEI